MKQSNSNRYGKLLRTILISGGAMALNALMTVFLVPVISNTVGTEAYGFVSLAKSFEQYAMIITTALNAFAARYIVIAYHKGDRETANTFFSSTVYGDAILSTALFLAAILVVLFMNRVMRISPELVPDVRLLFLFVFLNFWIVTMSTAFQSAGHIKNKLDVVGVFKTLSYFCEAVVLVLCFRLLPPHVFYVGIGLVAAALVTASGGIWLWRRYVPELHIRRRSFSWQAIRRLVLDGAWTSLNSLGGVLNDGLDLLVCNLMLTPLGMGQLAFSKTFHSLFASVFALVGQAFEPLFLKSYAQGDKKTLLEELRLSMKLSGMIGNIVFAGFAALGMAFYRLWIPKEDIALIYALTVINNLATIPRGPMFPLYYIYVLTTKNRFPTIMTIVSGLLNVLGMYLMLRYTGVGIYAIVWTTAVVSAVIDFISNPLYMAHVLELPWWTFYPSILRNLLSCGIMAAVFMGLGRLYVPSSWISLIVSAMVLGCVGCALHMLVALSSRERKEAVRIILRKNRGNEEQA